MYVFRIIWYIICTTYTRAGSCCWVERWCDVLVSPSHRSLVSNLEEGGRPSSLWDHQIIARERTGWEEEWGGAREGRRWRGGGFSAWNTSSELAALALVYFIIKSALKMLACCDICLPVVVHAGGMWSQTCCAAPLPTKTFTIIIVVLAVTPSDVGPCLRWYLLPGPGIWNCSPKPNESFDRYLSELLVPAIWCWLSSLLCASRVSVCFFFVCFFVFVSPSVFASVTRAHSRSGVVMGSPSAPSAARRV